MKNEIKTIIAGSVVGGVATAIISFFVQHVLNYPWLIPYSIIAFLLILNFWVTSNLLVRINRLEKEIKRNSYAVETIVGIFIKVHRSGITSPQDFIKAFHEGIVDVFDAITKDYFTSYHYTNPPEIERRKQKLLEKARQKIITYEEAQELEKMLENQRKQHLERGDITGAILAGLLLLFVLGVIAILLEQMKSQGLKK